jgi:uncharacterized membrane protein YjfL (UPF0719 family)
MGNHLQQAALAICRITLFFRFAELALFSLLLGFLYIKLYFASLSKQIENLYLVNALLDEYRLDSVSENRSALLDE